MGMGLGGANDSIGCNLMSWRIAFSSQLNFEVIKSNKLNFEVIKSNNLNLNPCK